MKRTISTWVRVLLAVMMMGNLAFAKGLSAEAKKRQARRIEERRVAHKALFDAVEKATSGARVAFANAANSDPKLKAEVAEYGKAAVAALQIKDAKKRKAAITDVKDKYRPLIGKIFRKGKIDEREYMKKAEDAVYKTMAVYPAYKGIKARFHWLEYLTVMIEWIQQHQDDDDGASGPQELNLTLSPPFPNVQEQGDAAVDRDAGRYTSRAEAHIVGSDVSLAGLGHFVDIPGGYDTVKVTAALPDSEYFLGATSILGASGCSSSSTAEIFMDNEIIVDETFAHADILTLVIWVVTEDGVDTYNVSAEEEAPNENTEVVFSFFNTTDCWAAANGHALGRTTDTPRDLKIKLTP
jgi:hypothetical protein